MGMWTRSGGKRWEFRELQESHMEGSLCSTANTRVSDQGQTGADRASRSLTGS